MHGQNHFKHCAFTWCNYSVNGDILPDIYLVCRPNVRILPCDSQRYAKSYAIVSHGFTGLVRLCKYYSIPRLAGLSLCLPGRIKETQPVETGPRNDAR